MLTTDELIDELQRLSTGLLYPSETDAPISVFEWRTGEKGAYTDENLMHDLGHPEDATLSEIETAEEFFDGLTDTYEWHTPEEIEMTKQFVELKEMLFANITKPRHIWIGEREVDVFVFGRTKDGDIIGLRTLIVET